jgi:hypothetical protein
MFDMRFTLVAPTGAPLAALFFALFFGLHGDAKWVLLVH